MLYSRAKTFQICSKCIQFLLNMIPEERREKLLELVDKFGVLSIPELSTKLDVSLITVRDIKILEEENKLQTVFGGVKTTISSKRISSEPSRLFFEKRAINEKEKISAYAANLIPEHSCIFLDAGTTTYFLAEKICNRKDLVVITNDFYITDLLLNKSESQIIHTGGSVSRSNHACVGNFAAASIQNYNIDLAFISATSWNIQGITTSDESKVALKRALYNHTKKRILLCDSGKYGTEATYVALPITAFDSIITDSGLDVIEQKKIIEKNINLIVLK